MITLQNAFELARTEQGLAVVATLRTDATIQSSVLTSSRP